MCISIYNDVVVTFAKLLNSSANDLFLKYGNICRSA